MYCYFIDLDHILALVIIVVGRYYRFATVMSAVCLHVIKSLNAYSLHFHHFQLYMKYLTILFNRHVCNSMDDIGIMIISHLVSV